MLSSTPIDHASLRKPNLCTWNAFSLKLYEVNEIRLTVNGTHYMRWQLPLILAYSITTHKSQSMTAHNGIVYEPSKNKPFARGLPYVAISRATDIEKVALLSPIRPDHFINKTFIAENIKITEFFNNLNKIFNSDKKI